MFVVVCVCVHVLVPCLWMCSGECVCVCLHCGCGPPGVLVHMVLMSG